MSSGLSSHAFLLKSQKAACHTEYRQSYQLQYTRFGCVGGIELDDKIVMGQMD